MVTDRQKRGIEKRMRRIKEARDKNMDEDIIRSRTNELLKYLDREGIRNIY